MGRWAVLSLLLLLTLLTIGCGHSRRDLNGAFGGSDLAESTAPTGVDPQVWEKLKAALTAAVAKYGPARGVSSVPSNSQSKVVDFALDHIDGSGALFTWTFRGQGDYDQNGEVNVSDLTPVGVNFGKTSSDPNWAKALSTDGNSDGAITISDVTPIGANFHNSFNGYLIEETLTPADESSWTFVLAVPLNQGVAPVGGGFNQFNALVATPVVNAYYRVRPYLGDPQSSPALGIASDPAMTADLQPPVGVTASAGTAADHVTVNWSAATGATGYEVYRDDQGAAAIGTTDGATLTFDDTTLVDFQPHTYWVKATYPTGSSPFSLPASGFRANRGDWWTFGHDAAHSGVSAFAGPQTNDINWGLKSAALSWAGSSPVLGADGTFYVGDFSGGTLYAFNSDGSEKWHLKLDDTIAATPAVGADGTIYVATEGFTTPGLYAVDPAGTQKWSYPLTNGVFGSPAIGPDGSIYVVDFDGQLFAINPNGTLHWGKPLGASGFDESSPALGPTGTIYCGGADQQLWAVDKDGNTVWTFAADGAPTDAPSVSTDGTLVFFGTGNGTFYAINAGSGKQRWNYPTATNEFFSAAAVRADNTTVIGGADGNLYSFNPNGTLAWSTPLGSEITGSPAIGSDGLAYIGTTAGLLYAVNPGGTIKWQRQVDSALNGSPCIQPDGSLLIGSSGGYMFRFAPRSPVAPAKPTGLKASQGAIYHAIHLTWDLAFDADGYEIYKDGAGAPIATVANVQSWTDTPVPDASNHTYVIKATNAYGTSPASSSATGKASNTTPAAGDWAMFGRDSAHTSLSALAGPHVLSTPWIAQAGTTLTDFTPCIGSNGELYVGSDNGNLYAIASDGGVIWSVPLAPVTGSAAIGTDGTIYVPTSTDLYAVNPDSSVKWHYTTGQPINAAPVIDAGNIYFATQDGNVISLDGTGGLNWQHSVGTLVFGSPAIGSNGAVYVCNVSDNQLVSLDASGNENWRFTGADNAIAAPTVKRSGAGDTIYFGTTGNRMYCVDASGSEVWHYDATGVIYGSAAIGSDGAIYFGSQDGYLYALEPAGTLRWSFNNFAAIDGPLAIDSAGFIYFGDTDGYLDVVKPDGSDYAWLDALGDTFFDGGPAIGPNKSVYIVGANGAVYGFH